MKKLHTISTAVCVILLLAMIMPAHGQRHSIPESLVGADLKQAQQAYLKEINRGVDSLIVPYAESLFYDGQQEKALKMFRKADSLGLEMNHRQQRNFSHLARRMGQTSPYDVEISRFSEDWQPLARIEPRCSNADHQDLGPFAWNDILFFSSSREPVGRRGRAAYDFTGQAFLNVYAFNQDCSPADISFLPSLNTGLHDGPIAIAKDTSMVIVTRNYQRPNEEGVQNLYLDLYTREEGTWSQDISFQFNDPAYSVQHPFYHDDTQTLYFSSNMPGGHGGFDLYSSQWNGQEWSEPVNLGLEINSAYDEVFPSLTPDGHLVYATNHIESPGGLSLVLFKDNTNHLFPEPINSSHDDYAVTFIDAHSGYFSSNRQQPPFGDNVYYFEMLPMPFVILARDSDSNRPLQGVQLVYEASEPPLSGQAVTGSGGEAVIYEGHESPFPVHLELSRDGFETLSMQTDAFVRKDNRWLMEVHVDPAPEADPSLHPAIVRAMEDGFFMVYFDNDQPDPWSWRRSTESKYPETLEAYLARRNEYFRESASSRQELEDFFTKAEEGMIQLEWFADFLKKEAEAGQALVIEFSSHTSPLAEESYNLILSERRYMSVKNYLLNWQGGILDSYKQQGLISFVNTPMGSQQAPPTVSSDRNDLPNSVYGVDAARERKVRIGWE